MVHAVLLGAGKGERMGFGVPKQLIKIAGKTILEHTIEVFENCEVIDNITLVISNDMRIIVEEIITRNDYKKIRKIITGGKTRRESSRIGVESLEANEEDVIVIHDIVRPFIDCDLLVRNVEGARKYGAVDTVMESPDTIVEIDEEGFAVNTLLRNRLRRSQTPQTFLYSIIKKAHELAKDDPDVDSYVTDDCGLVLRYGLGKVWTVHGSEYNIKITYPIDVHFSEVIYQLKRVRIFPGVDDLKALENRVVVIFDNDSEIGGELYNLMTSHGSKVFVFSKEVDVDIGDSEDLDKALKRVFKEHGKIDHVVNIDGTSKMNELTSLERVKKEIDTKYIGSINVITVSKKYLENTNGMLVLAQFGCGENHHIIHSSIESAIVSLVRTMANEEPRIRINVVIPERTATPLRFKNFGEEPKELLLNPRTVALIIAALLNRNLTGSVIEVRKIDEPHILEELK